MTSTSQNALEPNPQRGITLTLKKKKPKHSVEEKPQGDCYRRRNSKSVKVVLYGC